MISMRLISNFVCESHPVSCKCAIGVLALMRIEALYSVSLGIPERKLVMLFQCLAKLLTWNCFWRCAIGI